MTRRIIVVGTGIVAYGVIAEAASAGYEVVHISTRQGDLAARSGHIDEGHLVELRHDSDERVVDFLLKQAAAWSGALLVPVIDDCVVLFSKNLDRLAPHYRCTVMPWATHREIIGKDRLYRHAHELGVPAPQVFDVTDTRHIDELSARIVYPCIVKPHQTPDFFRAFHAKVFEVSTAQELRDACRRAADHDIDVMVSEIIPGEVADLVTYVSCLDVRGEPTLEAWTQKVRETRPFGVASIIRTTAPNETIRAQSLELLRHFGFRGFTATEWKRDARDGRYQLIEINSRPVLYNRLFVAAGVNVVDRLYRDYVCEETLDAVTARPDICWIHNASELRMLKRYLIDGRLGEFLAPYRESHVYGLPILRDPKPCLQLFRRETGAAWRKRFGRF